MIKNKKALIAAIMPFALAEIFLGVLLQIVSGRATEIIEYSAIILACLFCLLFAERSLSYIFTQAALIFTVFADYFLVYSEEIQQLPAMLFFSATQICYFLRLYFEDGDEKRKKWHLVCRISLSLAAITLTLAVLGKNCDALALVSMFYYANLILNVIFACIEFKKNPVFAIGLILFILCDTVIGLSMIDGYLPLSPESLIYKMIHPGFNLAWVFYVPSQALLSISLLPERLKNQK